MAKWGQDILLGKNGKQKYLSSLSSWMQWQWKWSLELCQKWQPQTSATGNMISWNLGPLDIHAAQLYIAQAMLKKAAIMMLQEIRIPRGSKFRVQRDFRRKYPEYKCYIAAGIDIDLVAVTDSDHVPRDGYNDGRAHITVVTILHKSVICPKALVVNWHKPREKKALEHMAHGCIFWLDAMTREGERISIINIHQATARRPDLQRRVNTQIQAETNKSEGRRRIMGGDLNAATSRTGYSISTKSHFEKVDNQFQECIQRTGGSLIQSEAHTRKDLMGGASLDDIKSATLDHIITWIFSNDDTADILAPKSTVHWLGAYANNHALISCTIDEQLLNYQDPWARDPGGRIGAIKAKNFDPKQIPRI